MIIRDPQELSKQMQRVNKALSEEIEQLKQIETSTEGWCVEDQMHRMLAIKELVNKLYRLSNGEER